MSAHCRAQDHFQGLFLAEGKERKGKRPVRYFYLGIAPGHSLTATHCFSDDFLVTPSLSRCAYAANGIDYLALKKLSVSSDFADRASAESTSQMQTSSPMELRGDMVDSVGPETWRSMYGAAHDTSMS